MMIFAGFLHVGFFFAEVQTGIRYDTSMESGRRRGGRCKIKVRAGWYEEHHPLISEETIEIVQQRPVCSMIALVFCLQTPDALLAGPARCTDSIPGTTDMVLSTSLMSSDNDGPANGDWPILG